jgi:radical SAM superfamily enzyme YgiQ (UPF0313 family)
MSSLGLQSLFHRLSLFHGLQVHRFFRERDGTLFSPDSAGKSSHALSSYDALFFSVSFELDYIHLLGMLLSSGIPPNREQRHNNHPPVIVGGVTVTANPHILSPVADVLYLGDMDNGIDDIVSILIENNFRWNEHVREHSAEVSGVYVPELHGMKTQGRLPVERVFQRVIDNPAHTVVLTGSTEFSNMFLIEMGRGCRNSCSFCMTRCVHRPLRSVQPKVVVEKAKLAVDFTRRIGLIAPVLTDHEGLSDTVEQLNHMELTVSFSSLRADDFNEHLAGLLKRNGQSTVTFAPETGSEKLRRSVGKRLTDNALLNAVSIALDNGIRRIRYYFMIGLPGESSHDIEALVDLVSKTTDLFPRRGVQLVLSINPFVPKMGTAMRFVRVHSMDYYNAVRSYILGELDRRSEVSVRFESFKKLYLHYYLSIGDHRIGGLLCQYLSTGTMKGFLGAASELLGY